MRLLVDCSAMYGVHGRRDLLRIQCSNKEKRNHGRESPEAVKGRPGRGVVEIQIALLVWEVAVSRLPRIPGIHQNSSRHDEGLRSISTPPSQLSTHTKP